VRCHNCGWAGQRTALSENRPCPKCRENPKKNGGKKTQAVRARMLREIAATEIARQFILEHWAIIKELYREGKVFIKKPDNYPIVELSRTGLEEMKEHEQFEDKDRRST
jgi:hypothetical protein